MNDLKKRTMEEVLKHHVEYLNAGHLDETMIDYDDNAVIVNMGGTVRGKDAIRVFFKNSIENVLPPETVYETLYTHIADDIAYIVWKAESPYVSVPFGTDTFFIKDGLIVKQTFAGEIIEK